MRNRASWAYLKVYVGAVAVILILFVSFNLVIDPFDLYSVDGLLGLNLMKTGTDKHIRLSKAGALRKIKPRAICLGTSRGEYGINPEHPGWKTLPVYNASLSGANNYELLRYFQHAHAIQPLKQVLIMVDLDQFNAYRDNRPDFAEERLAVTLDGEPVRFFWATDLSSTLFSLSALQESLNSIRITMAGRQGSYLPNGQMAWANDSLYKHIVQYGGYAKRFEAEERSLFAVRDKNWAPQWRDSFYKSETGANGFDAFRRMIRISIRDGVDLHVAINPSHARYWEAHRLMGSWYYWEEWKRKLVRVVEEEASFAGVKPFPLWDFSGFNPLSMERVPSREDERARMRWYVESSHYSTAMGDLLQDRVFDHHEPGREVPDYFGVRITSQNIESHLTDIRRQNVRFRTLQPDVAAELAEMAAQYDFADYIRDEEGNSITFKAIPGFSQAGVSE